VLIFITACATTPETPDTNDFANLDPGAQIYFTMDVQQYRDKLPATIPPELLDMTTRLSGAVYPDGHYLAIARGKYPASNANFALGLTKDWKKEKSDKSYRYWRNEGRELSVFVAKDYAFISNTIPFPQNGGAFVPETYSKFANGASLSGWMNEAGPALALFFSRRGIPLAPAVDRFLFASYPAGNARICMEFASEETAAGFYQVINIARKFLEHPFFENPPELDKNQLIFKLNSLDKIF
jgi:hypothetical protein